MLSFSIHRLSSECLVCLPLSPSNRKKNLVACPPETIATVIGVWVVFTVKLCQRKEKLSFSEGMQFQISCVIEKWPDFFSFLFCF